MTYVGVDWADGLWVVVTAGEETDVSTEPSILNVWQEYSNEADSILVDIPIGLPEAGPRACDQAAGELLGSRSSTVFSVPCRAAVHAETYPEAVEAAEDSVSSQSWWLFPRIKEVDVFLQTVDNATEIVYESHPEVCFAAFDGASVQSKQTDDGLDARLSLLEAVNEQLHETVHDQVMKRKDGTDWHDRLSQGRCDDIVDAAILAATAAHIELGNRSGELEYPSLPDGESGITDEPAEDPELSIPMEIVFPGRNAVARHR